MEYPILMRRYSNFLILGVAVAALTGCRPDEVIETEAIPTAGVRFIHAVPDTASMDMRFIDIIENNPHFNIAYRNNVVISPTGATGVPASTFIQFKGARAGSRDFRIFMNGNCTTTACDQSYASTIVKDTTVDLTQGVNYTALLWGYANPTGPSRPAGAPPMRLDFFEESVADPGAGQVALRVINATPSAIDVRFYADGDAPPAAASWANVPALSVSSYIVVPADQYWYNVQPAGGGAALFADRRALLGADAVTGPPGPFDAQPGTTVAGSAVTGIIFPRTVAGSQAPSVTTPSISFMWDRRPPRPAGI
jgi:hypothetical protein